MLTTRFPTTPSRTLTASWRWSCVSLLLARACYLLPLLRRGTHPAHARRTTRAPAASAPHAHTPARTRQPWTCLWPPRAALACTRAPVPPARGACKRAGQQPRTQVRPPGRKTTNQRRTTTKRCCASEDTSPKTPIDEARQHWASAPATGCPPCALFLPCERGSHRHHTAVVTRPRLRLAI